MRPEDFDKTRYNMGSRQEVALFADTVVATVDRWVRGGMPRTQISDSGKTEENARYIYNASDVFVWYRTKGPGSKFERRSKPVTGQSALEFSEDEDAMLVGPVTPAQERYRHWKAKLAELEYGKKSAALVPVEDMQTVVSALAAHIRAAGEQLGVRFGPEAQRLLNDSLDEFCQMASDHLSGAVQIDNDNDKGVDRSGQDPGSPPDGAMGGGRDLDTDGRAQGEAVPPQQASGEPDLVQRTGQRPVVAARGDGPDPERQDADGLRDTGSVPSV
jgi:phage terminase Nu1 subunit (DNA packaging protein)